jgi:outer membrane protein assembly factor BamA
LLAVLMCCAADAGAQIDGSIPGSQPARVESAGGELLWTTTWLPPDTSALRRSVVDSLASAGYGLARVLSVQTAPPSPPAQSPGEVDAPVDTAFVWVEFGPLLQVGDLALSGVDEERRRELIGLADTQIGELFRPRVLDADLHRIVGELTRQGFTLAQARVARLDLVPADSSVSIAVQIDLGASLRLDSIVVRGSGVRPHAVERMVGMRRGEVLVGYQPARVRRELEASGLFASVDSVRLRVRDGTQATLLIDATPASPGAFDVVLGVVPEAGGGASLVGSGFLSLLSPFGLGHRYRLRLDRQPGRTSRAEAAAELPYLPFVPVGLGLGFEGIQQDSTLSTQHLRAEVTYGSPAWQVFGSLSRETTNPGVGGVRLVGGRQQIAQASVTFVGVGIRADRRDRRISPRSGILAEVRVERGARRRSYGIQQGAQVERVREEQTQDRARASARLFAPVGRRVVLVTGGEGYLLRSDAYEVGELFRIGGTRTLRGYPDDRFRARQAVRVLGETRLLLDRTSYLYLFADLAWVDQPETAQAEVAALSGFFSGYGGGIQFETPLGLINASYAASPESSLSDGQVHVGLSFDL